MEDSLAKLADMAAPKGKVSFLATWWAKGSLCLFGHGFIGFNLLQICPNGKDLGTFLVAVMVRQHGPTSVLGVHQELGWLQ